LLGSLGSKSGKTINLHLPRKDWELIGVKKIIRDVKYLQKKIKISHLIIHKSDYKKYKKDLTDINKNILVENEDNGVCSEDKEVKQWVCDINHFYKNNKFNLSDFKKFISLNGDKIKEIHFSSKNHNVFSKKDISWLGDKLKIFSKMSGLVNKDLIFEGTSKDSKSLNELKGSLDYNIKLILKIICKI
jgi:hypothetical protein